MQDFDELKKLKAQCIADIREALPLYANRLNSIDTRLMTYIEDAISGEGSHSRSTSGRLLPARLCRLLPRSTSGRLLLKGRKKGRKKAGGKRNHELNTNYH